jgi:predicted TIM-barrel fold metal-dependent hydrolase
VDLWPTREPKAENVTDDIGGTNGTAPAVRGTLWPVSRRHKSHTLLDDPIKQEERFRIISVDDHLLEPPHTFRARIPGRLQDQVPYVEEVAGLPMWHIGGHIQPVIASNALSGRPKKEWDGMEPVRYDEMRRGSWDPTARVADMDLNGVRASLNFPSMIFGFAGQLFMELGSEEAGIAAVDAWNDFLYEEWFEPYQDRFVPMHLVWLGSSKVAADQVRRNAERGFTSVSFSENPQKLGLPSIHCGYWEPFFEACSDADMAINLHVGSSSTTILPSTDAPDAVTQLFFPLSGMVTSGDWLFSKVAIRYPNLKIVLSEAGIGWVPLLLDRLDHISRFLDGQPNTRDVWRDIDVSPSEALQRNFFFTTFEDPTSFRVIDRIGEDNVMVEVDYPHPDSSWPNTQELLAHQFRPLNEDVIKKVAHANAARVYRFEVS